MFWHGEMAFEHGMEEIMTWSERIYLSPSVRKHYRRIKWKIMHNIAQPGIFLLWLPMKTSGNPEIIPSAVLLQTDYPRDGYCVIGLAGTRGEALGLIEQITSDMYKKFKKIDYCSFFDAAKTEDH